MNIRFGNETLTAREFTGVAANQGVLLGQVVRVFNPNKSSNAYFQVTGVTPKGLVVGRETLPLNLPSSQDKFEIMA